MKTTGQTLMQFYTVGFTSEIKVEIFHLVHICASDNNKNLSFKVIHNSLAIPIAISLSCGTGLMTKNTTSDWRKPRLLLLLLTTGWMVAVPPFVHTSEENQTRMSYASSFSFTATWKWKTASATRTEDPSVKYQMVKLLNIL